MERHALRTCKDCGFSTTTFAGFVKNKGSKYGYRNLYISCAVKRNEANPKQKDWKTDHQTKKRYNVDVETYKRLMATSSCCQICESTQNLCYDHDHKTMEFRGVLCRSCNKAIGQLGDTVESLEKAVNYLKGIKQ